MPPTSFTDSARKRLSQAADIAVVKAVAAGGEVAGGAATGVAEDEEPVVIHVPHSDGSLNLAAPAPAPFSNGPPPKLPKYLPTKTQPQRRSCICGKDECRTITICFQSLKDVRGLHFAMPSLGATRQGDLKEFKIERTLVHLGMYSEDKSSWVCSVDQRNRSGKKAPKGAAAAGEATATGGDVAGEGVEATVDYDETQGELKAPALPPLSADGGDEDDPSAPPKKRSTYTRRYVALHHFHPEVLEAMVELGKTTIDTIPAKLIVDHGLLGNGYTEDDIFRGKSRGLGMKPKNKAEVFVPVPTYQHAKEDYILLSTRARLDRLVRSCREKNHRTNPAMNDITALRPVDKRRKLEALPSLDADNRWDLQRAVCMLSDKLDEAYNEISRLKRRQDELDVVLHAPTTSL